VKERKREREDERIENKKSIVESNRIHLKLVTDELGVLVRL
jgi:hypothetical protein